MMKALLTAIQDQLRSIPKVRPSDVFLSADKNLVLPGARYPCIGLKDGRVTRSALPGSVVELGLPVEIHIYEQLGQDDRAIRSIFDLSASVHDRLKDNELDGYVKEVEPGEETPVTLLYRESGMVLRKTLSYQYNREEE